MTVQPKIRIAHERTLADVARLALDGSETYQQAAERLLAMLTPDELQRLLEPYEISAALALRSGGTVTREAARWPGRTSS